MRIYALYIYMGIKFIVDISTGKELKPETLNEVK